MSTFGQSRCLEGAIPPQGMKIGTKNSIYFETWSRQGFYNMYMLPVINSLIINICAATINKQYANEIGASFETEERSLCVMIWIILLLTMGSWSRTMTSTSWTYNVDSWSWSYVTILQWWGISVGENSRTSNVVLLVLVAVWSSQVVYQIICIAIAPRSPLSFLQPPSTTSSSNVTMVLAFSEHHHRYFVI